GKAFFCTARRRSGASSRRVPSAPLPVELRKRGSARNSLTHNRNGGLRKKNNRHGSTWGGLHASQEAGGVGACLDGRAGRRGRCGANRGGSAGRKQARR